MPPHPPAVPFVEPASTRSGLAPLAGTLLWASGAWLLFGGLRQVYWPWYKRTCGSLLPDLVKTITRATLVFAPAIGYSSVVLNVSISGVIAGSSVDDDSLAGMKPGPSGGKRTGSAFRWLKVSGNREAYGIPRAEEQAERARRPAAGCGC
jgi:hypothetical protein